MYQNLSEVLETIKFVDKIIFGKLNYNVAVSKYQNNKEFYEQCANTVIDFCKKNNIELNNLTTNSVIKYNMKKFEEIISNKCL